MFRVNNKDTRTTSSVFIVSFEHISHLILAFLLLALNMYFPAGFEVPCIVGFFKPNRIGLENIL